MPAQMPPKMHYAKDGDLAARGPQVVAVSQTNRTPTKFSKVVRGSDSGLVIATAASHASNVTFRPPTYKSEWTKDDEQALQKFIVRKATGKLTDKEMSELELLKATKRALKFPQPSSSILRKYKEEKALNILLKALDRYVEIIGSASF
jgi:hypothetical protein